jgi:hypothetical protein
LGEAEVPGVISLLNVQLDSEHFSRVVSFTFLLSYSPVLRLNGTNEFRMAVQVVEEETEGGSGGKGDFGWISSRGNAP